VVSYSVTHEAMYDEMISEMLRFAGFQDSVNDKLRGIVGVPTAQQARWVDDLYGIYSNQSVIDDED
jgi:hypothetical protein